MKKIELVLPKAHQNLDLSPGVQREMSDVQRELDSKGDRLPTGRINFVISKGFYKHEEKIMRVASVIVNTTDKDINTLEMRLLFNLRNNPNAEFAPMHAVLDEEFLGVINSKQAFILHIDVPAENVGDKDMVFQPSQIAGEIKNIKYHFSS